MEKYLLLLCGLFFSIFTCATEPVEEIVLSKSTKASGCLFNNEFVEETNSKLYERQWTTMLHVGYGFLERPKATEGLCCTYFARIGTNYNIDDSHYLGARVGYNSANYFDYCEYNDLQFHLVALLIETGHRYKITDKFFVIPYAGLDFNVCVNGTGEDIKSSKDNVDLDVEGKIGIGGRFGVKLDWNGFVFDASYICPLNSKQKKFLGENACFELSLGTEI